MSWKQKLQIDLAMLCSMHYLNRITKFPHYNQLTKNVYRVLLLYGRRFAHFQFTPKSSNLLQTNHSKLVINEPKIMKLDTPQFRSCLTEEVIFLKNLFTKYGYEIRIVGGAVRDLLLGIQPLDLDFSTTATPVEMKLMFTENNIRLINSNGEKHGTITARIQEKNFEVTTLRIDVLTDGRHAVVEFTKNWALDANRRDLTINAMYLGLDGTLYDYFNGYEDLKNKKIVFVGDAVARIREDYLRILRYFRFYGRIADSPDNHDENVLKAIQENAEGLLGISGERLWVELFKILQGRFAGDVILKMLKIGLFPYLELPEKPNEGEFRKVWEAIKKKDLEAEPITFLVALFNTEEEFNNFALRMKLSNLHRDLGYFILQNREDKLDPNPKRVYQILLLDSKRKSNQVFELLKYQGKFNLLEELQNWEVPVFPIKGQYLLQKGLKGKLVGETLTKLRRIWCEHDFNISREELLKFVPDINEKEK